MELDLSLPAPKTLQLAIKRGVDIAASLAGLVLLSPVFLLVACLVRLTSPGNILFHQVRIGRDGRPFKLLKFRTMRPGAAEVFQEYLARDPKLRLEYSLYQKLERDPRLTRIGGFLRRSSLDELPQLWNILKGEMSLVGPRPFLPEQWPLYGRGAAACLRVRPGLTGLWQVSGRNRLSFAERAACDQDYLSRWSLWLDLEILARTPAAVLGRDGAY